MFKWLFSLNGLKFLIVSHHFAKFSGHKSCGSNDTAAKISYMTLQDRVIKDSGDFTEGISSMHILTLPKLIATCVNGYKIVLVCHVILQGYVIIRSYDFMWHSRQVIVLRSFVALDIVVVEICF